MSRSSERFFLLLFVRAQGEKVFVAARNVNSRKQKSLHTTITQRRPLEQKIGVWIYKVVRLHAPPKIQKAMRDKFLATRSRTSLRNTRPETTQYLVPSSMDGKPARQRPLLQHQHGVWGGSHKRRVFGGGGRRWVQTGVWRGTAQKNPLPSAPC